MRTTSCHLCSIDTIYEWHLLQWNSLSFRFSGLIKPKQRNQINWCDGLGADNITNPNPKAYSGTNPKRRGQPNTFDQIFLNTALKWRNSAGGRPKFIYVYPPLSSAVIPARVRAVSDFNLTLWSIDWLVCVVNINLQQKILDFRKCHFSGFWLSWILQLTCVAWYVLILNKSCYQNLQIWYKNVF